MVQHIQRTVLQVAALKAEPHFLALSTLSETHGKLICLKCALKGLDVHRGHQYEVLDKAGSAEKQKATINQAL